MEIEAAKIIATAIAIAVGKLQLSILGFCLAYIGMNLIKRKGKE